jgi:3-oxoacyl-[acyl-carrier-protein] synthase II
MPRPPVDVVGAGLKAPGGLSPDELWASWCSGGSSTTLFEDDRLASAIPVSTVAGFDASACLTAIELRRYDRAHALAIAAATDALAEITDRPDPARCAVVCGVGLGAATSYEQQLEGLLRGGLPGLSPLAIPVVMPSSTAALLSLRFGFGGPCLTLSGACASGAMAIGEGVELIRRGAADLVLAGGVDALVTYGALCGFRKLDAMSRTLPPSPSSRPFDIDRDGFVMGEGAGFVVLRPTGQASPLGTVLGYGTSADAYHLVAPDPAGAGARRCIRAALDDAGVSTPDVNHINAHGTSTQLNDLVEGQVVLDVFGADPPPVTALKGTTGHLIGGSGAVEAIMTMWALDRGLAPPVAGLRTVDPKIGVDVVNGCARTLTAGVGLSNSFGFGGVNAALVLGGPQLEQR